jgi:hypothetical protein
VDLKNYLQLIGECFKVLPHLLKIRTEIQNTRTRRGISAEEILTATLRFFATGRNFEEIKFSTLTSLEALA